MRRLRRRLPLFASLVWFELVSTLSLVLAVETTGRPLFLVGRTSLVLSLVERTGELEDTLLIDTPQ